MLVLFVYLIVMKNNNKKGTKQMKYSKLKTLSRGGIRKALKNKTSREVYEMYKGLNYSQKHSYKGLVIWSMIIKLSGGYSK